MGLLVNVREGWGTFLKTDEASGAKAFFTTDPAIGIFTEKLGTIEESITNAQLKVGLNIVIATVVAKGAQNQIMTLPGGARGRSLLFKKILCVARIMENPKVNQTGICASDCAEGVAWFTHYFQPDGYVMELEDITLASHPKVPVAYDVIYTLEAGINQAPARPA